MTGGTSVIFVLSCANFVIGMGGFMVIGLLPPFAGAFGISPAQAGWLMTAYALGYAILSPVLVSVTGRIGRRRVLAAGMSVFGLSCLAAACAPTPEAAYATRFLAAGGAGVVTPVASAVAAGLSPPDRQGRALSSVFIGLTVAQVIGVPIGTWLAFTYGWQSAFVVVFLLSLPVIAAIWIRVPAGLSFAPVTLSALGQTLRDPRLVLAVSFTALLMTGTYVLYTYVAPLLTETMGFGRDGVSLVLLLFGIGAVAGNVLGGQMSDRIGPTLWLIVMTMTLSINTALFSALPLPVWAVSLMSMTWAMLGFSFMSAQQSRLISLASERAQVLLALNAAAIYVGAALGAAIGATVLHRLGPNALGLCAGAISILATISLLPKLTPASPPTR